MTNNIVSYDKKGFIIKGKREFLIGGEFHYFRVPAALWEDRLQKMRSTGANLISVYIAWNMHEPEEGKEIWSGDYDLGRFLTLCKQYGFFVLIKPGPYICAELDFGGHPDWLIAKIAKKEFRIRMLDEGYLKLCKKWYKTVSDQINPHLITNGGPIIAAQIENEYDHLIEYGEETITVQDAVDYLMYLKAAMEEVGIDVPKFANEAAFLRGKGVIDTRTYYPNIPGLWMWEFDLFEGKIIDSKKAQNDSPVMILELQAGWFSQIGVPTYEPNLSVVEGVSKSVLIQGASIINYYMMVGGTTFPFIGARGDVIFLGGLGNITSYDFGGSPIGESGELQKDKYYWIKGFIRFASEFAHLIAESDGKSFASIVSGGENIALLSRTGAVTDYSVDKCHENFKIYEEGTKEGRFVFLRNLEKEDKHLTLKLDSLLLGKEVSFATTIQAYETRMLPVAFKVPGTDLVVNYATSEVLLSKKYQNNTAFIMYGKQGTDSEICLNVKASEIQIVKGDVKVFDTEMGCLLQLVHNDISIIKVKDVTLFIVQESLIGRIEELTDSLLFSNLYYMMEVKENKSELELDMQIKQNSDNGI
ncbi:MAG: beta-galactosidase, partial [Vallitaleaceae bacterium]|nr:beta-galactosidase [Vallitaleaceae bacterium]